MSRALGAFNHRIGYMVKFLIWLLLLVVCWPLALLALVAYPFVWLLLLPLRLVGIVVDGLRSPGCTHPSAGSGDRREQVGAATDEPPTRPRIPHPLTPVLPTKGCLSTDFGFAVTHGSVV